MASGTDSVVSRPSVSCSPVHNSTPHHLELIGKVEGYDETINMAAIIPREEGVICVSDDRTIKIWMKRYTGQYWPSICQNTPGACISMDFCVDSRQLVVGLDNGIIMEFKVGEDYNKMHQVRDYSAHSGRVTGVQIVEDRDFLLSCGADKCFLVHCTATGRRVAGYQLSAAGSAVLYYASSSYAFVGDSSGQITVLKLHDDKVDRVRILKKHTGVVQCMVLDKDRHLLFSASHDLSIIIWNLKDADFKSFELHGHLDKVRGLSFCGSSNQLLSVGEDSVLACWDMTRPRDPPAVWKEQ